MHIITASVSVILWVNKIVKQQTGVNIYTQCKKWEKKNIFSTHRLSATNDRNIWLSIGLFVYAQLFYRFSVGIFASFGWCRLLYPPFSTLVQLLISFFFSNFSIFQWQFCLSLCKRRPYVWIAFELCITKHWLRTSTNSHCRHVCNTFLKKVYFDVRIVMDIQLHNFFLWKITFVHSTNNRFIWFRDDCHDL